MNSKIKILLFFCISLTSCVCEDCTDSNAKVPAYANKSGETVKIFAIAEGHPPYEKLIANGDTLHYTVEGALCSVGGFVSFNGCDKLVKMELHFLGESEKCLIFDGTIKHDGIDMRSWKSYNEGKKIPNSTDVLIEYVYTITPEHKAMAKEEDCPSSASE
jgi:hypothetical protein